MPGPQTISGAWLRCASRNARNTSGSKQSAVSVKPQLAAAHAVSSRGSGVSSVRRAGEPVVANGWVWVGEVGQKPCAPGSIAARLGDVALVAHEPVSFYDPADSGPFQLVCRHGSLTAAEILVPFVAAAR